MSGNSDAFLQLMALQRKIHANAGVFGTLCGRRVWPQHDVKTDVPQTSNSSNFNGYVCRGNCKEGLYGKPNLWVRLTPSSLIRCNPELLVGQFFYQRLNKYTFITSLDAKDFVKIPVEGWNDSRVAIKNWTRLKVRNSESVHEQFLRSYNEVSPVYPCYLIPKGRYQVEPYTMQEIGLIGK